MGLLVPCVKVAVRQDHLRLWICGYELLSEENRRHVGHALAVPEQLVKFGTPIWLALSVVLCFQSFHPHLIVARVLEKRLPTVVTLVNAQQTERSACCCQYYISRESGSSWWHELTFGRRPTHSQHQYFHGDRPLAILLPVDVCDYTGVVCEVSWLRHICDSTQRLSILFVAVVSDRWLPITFGLSYCLTSVDPAMHASHASRCRTCPVPT
jgi:hypothetical protein